MQIKKGIGWRACFDEQTGLYTAKSSWRGDYYLYEITKEIFDRLDNHDKDEYPDDMIKTGRLLYESHDNEYSSPYDIVHDESYKEKFGWLDEMQQTGHVWSKEMTQAVDEIFGVNKDKQE